MIMKMNLNPVLVICAAAILACSCAPVYVPNTVNVPLFTNRNEIQASLHAGTSGFDPQIAYAVTDHLGLMVNASFMNNTSDSTDNFHKHRFFEGGAGYYTHFATRGKFETFLGFGSGRVSSLYSNNIWTSSSDARFNRIFIQPSLGFTTKVVDLGLSSRLVLVGFNQDSERNSGFFIEPALTLKAGYDHIKAVGQLGFSLPVNEDEIPFNYQPLIISLGIQANFGKIFK